MEFNQKLQELRRRKGLTQEELAEFLFVSRTAVSKWESGRGYPNIDSLKSIAKFYNVSIDELLSGDELLAIAEADNKKKGSYLCQTVFGLLDCCDVLFFILPFFGQEVNGIIQAVSLFSLIEISLYLRILYFLSVIALIIAGVIMLTLRNLQLKIKISISFFCNIAGALVFIISSQPYAAALLFVFFVIKVTLLMKMQ